MTETANKRFRAGAAYGGALGVIDTHRGNRAVAIVLPDKHHPRSSGLVLDLIVKALNDEQERRTAAVAASAPE